MQRRLVVALLLAGVVAGGCTQGFVLEDGERPKADLTQARFAFAEGETEIELGSAPTSLVPTATTTPTVAPTEAPSPEVVSPSPKVRATTSTPPPVTAGPAETTVTGKVTVPMGGFDPAVIAANPAAAAMTIPNAGVDPGLETFDETSDLTVVFSPEIFAGRGIEGFAAVFSGRQPESGALIERQRPVQMIQFVFVHESPQSAQDFYEFLSTNFIGSSAATRVQALEDPYPNLESSFTGFGNVPQISDQVTLAILEMDPRVPADAPVQGPAVPTIYYIVLQQGLVTAVLEIAYLAQQDPSDVLLIGDVLVSRIPPELGASTGP